MIPNREKILFLLDGYDEISEDSQLNFYTILFDKFKDSLKIKIIMTCRK